MFSFFFDRMGLAFYKFSVHSNKIYAVIVSASRYFLLVIFHVQTRRGRNVLSVQPLSSPSVQRRYVFDDTSDLRASLLDLGHC